MNAAILTASDKGYRGEREDLTTPAVAALLEEKGFAVLQTVLLPDSPKRLENAMREICDKGGVQLLVTTGGTGFSKRDCMPEVTQKVVKRLVPGIPEAMRYASLQITPRAMLSRATAGIRGETLIVNLPGSPKAAVENLAAVIDTLPHGLEILNGEASDCAARSAYVYMVRCNDGTFYSGWTFDVTSRVKAHNSSSHGAKYTSSRRPVALCYTEELPSKEAAMRREVQLKRLPAAKKRELAKKWAEGSN